MKNQHRSKQEAEILVNENIGLLVSIAKQFNPKNHTELENYISAGSLGIVRAAYTFDISRGVFSTHATHCIKNEILKYIKYEKKHIHCLPIEDTPYEETNSIINDILPTCLTTEEKQIVLMKRGGYSNKDICLSLDISKAKLKIKIKKLLSKIRKYQ